VYVLLTGRICVDGMLIICVVLGHQDWLDGLVKAARGEEVGKTNLEAIDFPVRQLAENGFA
jgi:hypothetical protein